MSDLISAFLCPTKILFGVGAHEQLASTVKDWPAGRFLIVVDPALARSALFDKLHGILESQGRAPAVFSDIEPEPSDTTVERALAIARENGVVALLALGGGSTMDVAKCVGILMTNGGQVSDYQGIDMFSVAPLPLVAIPTTAGTGSEVSGAAVITHSQTHRKMVIRHAAFNPAKIAILDPLAVATAPAHVAAHAGMDAFVHAFESYLSKKATVFSDAVNLHAMKLIAGNIRDFVADRTHAPSALNMLCGSALAALSFGVTGLGNVHCMAMALGTNFPVPHGLANAVCLPYAAEFNVPVRSERFATVASILGVNVRNLDDAEAAALAIGSLRKLCADLSIPTRLRDVGVTANKLDDMAKLCFSADYNRWNPRHTTETDFRMLFHTAF